MLTTLSISQPFFDVKEKVFELKNHAVFHKGVATALTIESDEKAFNLIISSLDWKYIDIYKDGNDALKKMK